MAGLRRARANDRPRQRPTGPGSSRGSRPSRGFPARTPYSRWTRRAGGLRATHFTKSLRPITWSRSKPSAPPRVEALGRAEIELPPVAESTNKGHVFHAAPALAAGSGAREATAEFVHVTVVAVVEIVDVLTEPEAAAFAAEWSFGPYGFVLAKISRFGRRCWEVNSGLSHASGDLRRRVARAFRSTEQHRTRPATASPS